MLKTMYKEIALKELQVSTFIKGNSNQSTLRSSLDAVSSAEWHWWFKDRVPTLKNRIASLFKLIEFSTPHNAYLQTTKETLNYSR
jgi:hypothetical protein